MRRLRVLLILVLLLASVAPTGAQLPRLPGPGGILDYNTASISVANTTSAISLYPVTIPGALVATQPAINATTLWTTTVPLHLKMLGTINTSAGNPTMSLAVNYGGSAATLALLNNALVVGNIVNLPVTIEVWLSPIASFAATNISGNNQTVYLQARWTHAATATIQSGSSTLPASVVVYNASVLGTTRLASPVALNVLAQWGAANGLNSLTIYQRILKIGN